MEFDYNQLPLETQEALDNLSEMTLGEICDYFDRLAADHIESGTYNTAADYIYAAMRLRSLARTLATAIE